MDLGLATLRVVVGVTCIVPVAVAQHTTRVSVSSNGNQGDSDSGAPQSLSADGRFVAFTSIATNLVSGDTNGTYDVFVHDTQTGTTTRVSVDSAGNEGNSESIAPSISADSRFVAFWSDATNLVSGDTNGKSDVFIHDTQAGTTTIVSVDSAGNQGDYGSKAPSITADGRFVAFWSDATNLVSGDTNHSRDIFVHDTQSGTTTRMSVDSSGNEANGSSLKPSITPDGRFVAFDSAATNLVAGDTNNANDVFVHDTQTGTTTRVSLDSAGNQGNAGSELPSISADGRFVAFASGATNLVSGDTNNREDIFVHDAQTGTTTRVSVDSRGKQGNLDSIWHSVSADGRLVAFESDSTNLVSGDTNGTPDVFIHDTQAGTTTLVSVDSSGNEGNAVSEFPSISADGRFVAFDGNSTNLVSGDTNNQNDVFVHGSYLTLEADPQSVVAGATLTFTAWTGSATAASVLVVVDVNSTPLFLPIVFSSFDASGVWSLAATVPSGLSGITANFETFGIVPTGKLNASNAVTVSFL